MTPEEEFQEHLDQAFAPMERYARAMGIKMAMEDFSGKMMIVNILCGIFSWWLTQKQHWPLEILWLNGLLFIGTFLWMGMVIPRQIEKEYAEQDEEKKNRKKSVEG